MAKSFKQLKWLAFILYFVLFACYLFNVKVSGSNVKENNNLELESNDSINAEDFSIKIENRNYKLFISSSLSNYENCINCILFIPESEKEKEIKLESIYNKDFIYSGKGVFDNKDGSCFLDFSFSENSIILIEISNDLKSTFLSIALSSCSKNIPTVFLETKDISSFEAVEADLNHNTKADGIISVLYDNDYTINNLKMVVKGRGNASWGRAKKSFQITLDKKENILGMEKAKKWILLSNTADNTLLRNSVGLWLAQELGIKYACDYRFCDLFINGEYRGVYLLCEKIEINETRINISDLEGTIKKYTKSMKKNYLSEILKDFSDDYRIGVIDDFTNIDLTGGYHLEMDNYEDELQFKTSKYDLKITIKAPENLDENIKDGKAYNYIKRFINYVEEIISQDNVSRKELSKYIDIESFALMWLHTESLASMDAAYNFHMWKESDISGDGLLHAGPAWDMDRSANRDLHSLEDNDALFRQTITGDPETGEYVGYRWMDLLLNHDCFKEEIVRQYYLHKDLFVCCDECGCLDMKDENAIFNSNCTCKLREICVEFSNLIQESANNDMIRWDGFSAYCGGSKIYQRNLEMAVLLKFYCVRNSYLLNRMSDLATLYPVTFREEGCEDRIIYIGKTGINNLPDPFKKEGFIGWGYKNDSGENIILLKDVPVNQEITVFAMYKSIDNKGVLILIIVGIAVLLVSISINSKKKRQI